MSELKPCPFCGGDDMAVSVDGGVSPGYVDVCQKYVCTCTISCERCHAEIHGYAASNITCDLYDRSVNEAAAAWNTRHVETCSNKRGICSACGSIMYDAPNYCAICGRKVEG